MTPPEDVAAADSAAAKAFIRSVVANEPEFERRERVYRRRLCESHFGRDLLVAQNPTLVAKQDAVGAELAELAQMMMSPDPLTADAAALGMNRITSLAYADAQPHVGEETSAVYRAMRDTFAWVGRTGGISPAWSYARRSAAMDWWGWSSAILTAAAAVLMGAAGGDRWGLVAATYLVATRLVGSCFVWGWSSFPGDASSSDRGFVVDTRACVAGHLADAAALGAAALALYEMERTWLATGVVFSAFAMIGATLFRTAALQEGAWVSRLHFERLARGGSLLAGLLAATIMTRGSGADFDAAVLALVALGPALYALVEGWETNRKLLEVRRRHRDLAPEARQILSGAVVATRLADSDVATAR